MKRIFLLFALLFGTCAIAPAQTESNTKDIVKTPIADSPTFAKRALVIGVNGYDHVQSLQVCAQDASSFADALRSRMGFTNVTLMTDAPGTPRELLPTRNNIRRAIKTLTDGTIANTSEVVLFFSGHGVRAEGDQDWLVPSDGDAGDVAGTCISYDDFKRALKTRRPRRALLVVDACRNLLPGKSVASSGFGKGERALDLMGPQFAELQSCQPTEISMEAVAPLRNSVFTHYLLRALDGDPEAKQPGTEVVTFDSLKVYLQGQVSGYVAEKFNSSQLPDGVATLGGMVLYRPPEMLAPVVLPPVVPPAVKPPIVSPPVFSPLPPVVPSIPTSPVVGMTRINPKDGAEMVWVPAGEFLRGTSDAEEAAMQAIDTALGTENYVGWDEKPQRSIYLDGYWVYKTEVTVAQYRKFCGATGRSMAEAPFWGWKEDHPIVKVSWNDARAYCQWANAQLPSEAQWEKAARGRDGRLFPWGNKWPRGQAMGNFRGDEFSATYKIPNYQDGFASTSPVGSFPLGASPYGALDMAGNVYEWCEDTYDANFYSGATARNPLNDNAGKECVLRGGSWSNFGPSTFRASSRTWVAPSDSNDDIGFRCIVPGP